MKHSTIQPAHSENYEQLTTVLGADTAQIKPAIRSRGVAPKDLDCFTGRQPTDLSTDGKDLSVIERDILRRIDKDDCFACDVLLRLHNFQTFYEQENRITVIKNFVGFSASDARTFSAIAERIQDGYITDDDLAVLRKRGEDGISRLGKYRRQIAGLIRGSVN
jgi:hypothetical protein